MNELTTQEQDEYERHEANIAEGLKTFIEVGNSLLAIRDKRLYRRDYASFEEYCQTRWGMTRRHANRLVGAAEVAKNVGPNGSLPASERQARPLTSLTPEQQREAWQEAVETAPNGRITAQHVKDVVDRRNGNGRSSLAAYERGYQREVEAEREHPCVRCGEFYPEYELIEEPDGVWFCEACHAETQAINDEPNGSRMKPKTSYPATEHTAQKIDACQTPPYALDPLLAYVPREWTIWEPAAGEHLLVDGLYDAGFQQVIASDIITGQDFFDYEPSENYHATITNPPYSLKYPWLKRCYELGKPFALLLPVETLGAKSGQVLFREYGLQVIFMDRRINFKMPLIGFEGSSAQFPVAWFTFGLDLPSDMVFTEMTRDE